MISKSKCIAVGCPYYKKEHKVYKYGVEKVIKPICRYDDFFLHFMYECPLKKF